MSQDKPPIRLLYIMGTARSGSTILEILLAQTKDAFGAGELSYLVQDGLIAHKDCSCGTSFQKCPVWGRIQEVLGIPKTLYEDWEKLQRSVDWHPGFFRQCFGLLGSKERERYTKYNLALLQAIREVTEAAIIVDSSKYAGRALALGRMEGIDLWVLCLTRDPEGLMASFQKPNEDEQLPKRPLAVLFYYMVTLFSLRMASFLLDKQQIYLLRYEDLVADPRIVLKSIGRWAKIDLSKAEFHLKEQSAFSVGHLITANRLRKQGAIRFDPIMNRKRSKEFSARLIVFLMKIWRWLLRF